jgi:Protein of unknown function (DUF1569)
MKSSFNQADVAEMIARINLLTPESHRLWGKMTVDQMLAHLNVPYEMGIDNSHPRPGFFARFMAKLFAKSMVVGEKPYPKNGMTAPSFVMKGAKDFDKEKQRLIAYLEKTLALGAQHFEGKESLSFGPLTAKEWSILFYKHNDHHLQQFGV